MQVNQTRTLSMPMKIVVKMALIAIFSALSYVATMIHIPIPSPLGKPMIHFGNLVVIIASLLFGGVVGGVSGSIGMGLYDFLNGYDIWSITRTVVLKLIMGLIVGTIYQKLRQKNTNKFKIIIPIIGTIFLLGGLTFMLIDLFNHHNLINPISGKTEIITWPVYTFSIVNGLFLIIISIFNYKIPPRLQIASFACSVAIAVNILGEFIYKVIKQATLGGSNLNDAMFAGVLSLPATLINAMISLAILLIIFIPIEDAIRKSFNN